ncbi:MAG: CoA-binding protein [Smithellaceae bacterium]
MFTNYEKIFNPGKIAIIGVSANDGGQGFGSGILLSIQTMGFAGDIFPVNPKGGSFSGLTIYKKIEDIPGTIDFAIISVPAHTVPGILEACRQKGAAGAEILSSGFEELGTKQGFELEEEIRKIAAKGIRVIGPNCFGIYCPKSGLTFLANPDLPRETGPVAFLSQSGGMASDFMSTGKWMGFRFSKAVSFGNGADLRETELLRYLGDDPETGVISMYVEGIKDGNDFFETIKNVARKKPIIICKGGLSRAGRKAVVSHTASMGGSRVIWESILQQVHAVQVRDMQEMAQACLAFSFLPQKRFASISVVGGGGALGVVACDAAEANSIEVPSFSPELRALIEAPLPKPGSSGGNPVDVGNPYISPQVLKEVLLHAAKDDRIDLQVLITLLHHFKVMARSLPGKSVAGVMPYRELADAVGDVVTTTGKPVIVVLQNAQRGTDDLDVVELTAKARQAFIERRIPVFDEIGDALRALKHVNTYYQRGNNE